MPRRLSCVLRPPGACSAPKCAAEVEAEMAPLNEATQRLARDGVVVPLRAPQRLSVQGVSIFFEEDPRLSLAFAQLTLRAHAGYSQEDCRLVLASLCGSALRREAASCGVRLTLLGQGPARLQLCGAAPALAALLKRLSQVLCAAQRGAQPVYRETVRSLALLRDGDALSDEALAHRVLDVSAQAAERVLDREALRLARERLLVGRNLVVGLLGEGVGGAPVRVLRATLSALRRGRVPGGTAPRSRGDVAPLQLVSRPGSPQAGLLTVLELPPARGPSALALVVLNQIFAGGFASRLVSSLRGELGLSYSVYGLIDFETPRERWALWSAPCATQLERTLEVTLAELNRFLREGPTEAEFLTACEALARSATHDGQSPAARLNEGLELELLGLVPEPSSDLGVRLAALSLPDLRLALRRCRLATRSLALVVPPAQVSATTALFDDEVCHWQLRQGKLRRRAGR